MGNNKSLPKSKSAEQLSQNKRKKKNKRKAQDAHTSCPDITSGAVPYKNHAEDDSKPVNYKLYQSYGDLNFTPSDSMPDLKYYRRNTDTYATMPRTRLSESAVPLMNGNTKQNDSIKRHFSERTAFKQDPKRQAVSTDILDGHRPPNGSLGRQSQQHVRFPNFREVAKKVRLFQETYQVEFAKQFAQVDCNKCLSRIEVAQSLVMPMWKVSVKDYLEDEDTLHMVERMMAQENAAITLPNAFFSTVNCIRSLPKKDKNLWLPLARDIIDFIAKETSIELGRIYEYQIAMLEPTRTVELLAKHAVMKVYLSVTQGKHWIERNAVLHTVVHGGTSSMEGTRMIFSVLIGSKEYKWPMHNVFLKPGIRDDLWDCENGISIAYHMDHAKLEPRTYGYRGILYDWNYGTKTYSVGHIDSKMIKNDNDDSVFKDIHQGYIPFRRVLGTRALEQYLAPTSVQPKQNKCLKDFVNRQNNLVPPGPDSGVDPAFCVRAEDDIDAVNWCDTDWANVDLSRIQIPRGNLQGSSLRGACLMCANLENTDLRGANINYSDLSYSELQGAQVSLSDLQSTKAIYVNIGEEGTISSQPDSEIHAAEECSGKITDSKGNVHTVPQVVEDIEKRGIALLTATPPTKPSRGRQEGIPDSGIARSESGHLPGDTKKLKVQRLEHSKSATGERPRPNKVKRNQSEVHKKENFTDANILDDVDGTYPTRKYRGINTIVESDTSPEKAPVVRKEPPGRAVNRDNAAKVLARNPPSKPLYLVPKASPEESSPRRELVVLRRPLNERVFKMVDSSPSRSSQVSGSPSRLSPAFGGSDPDLRARPPQNGNSLPKRVSVATEAVQQEMTYRPWLPTDPKRRSFPLMKAPVPLPETNLSKLEGDLPPLQTTFIGRNTEVRQICKMLGQEKRLVCLHGEPAIGKSSVAIAAGHEARIILGTAVFYANIRGCPTTRTVILKFMDQLGLRLDTEDLAMFYNWMNSHKDHVLFVIDDTNLFKGDPEELITLVDDLLSKIPNLSIILCGTESQYQGQADHELLKISELSEGGGELFRLYNADMSTEDTDRYAAMCGNNPTCISLIAKAVKCGALPEDSIEGYLDALGLNLAALSIENIASRIAADQGMVQSLIITSRAVLTVLDTLRDSEKRLLGNLTLYPASFNKASADSLTWPNEDDNDAEYATPFLNLVEMGLIQSLENDRYLIQNTVSNIAAEHLQTRDLNQDLYRGEILRQLEECINLYHSPKWEQALVKYRYIRDDTEGILGRLSLDLSLNDSIHILEVLEGAIFLNEVLSDDLFRRTYLNLLELAVSTDDQMWEMSVECCLAYAAVKKNEFSDAKIHTDRANELFNEIQDTATPSYKSFCLLMNGIVSANDGNLSEALNQIKTALDIEKDTIKLKKVLTLHTYEEYARLNMKIGRMPTARHYYNIGDYIINEICGPHPIVLDGYRHREEIWDRMLLFNRATEVARAAADVSEKAYLEHPLTADAQANLCECIMKRGVLIDAFDAAAAALSLRKRLLGSHPDTAMSYKTVAYLYLRMGHNKEALSHAKKALEIMKENTMGTKHEKDVETLIEQVNVRVAKAAEPVVQIRPSSPKSPTFGGTAV